MVKLVLERQVQRLLGFVEVMSFRIGMAKRTGEWKFA